MKKYIENIRASVKKKGYIPTSDQIRHAINIVCPDGVNILENKSLIVDEVVKLLSPPTSPIESEIIVENTPLPIPEPEQESSTREIIVSSEQKHELVTAQSDVLDVELSDAETIELCSNIPDVFDDYETFISSVTDAIKIFIDEKFDRQEKQSVNNSINDLRQHIATRQTRLDSKFAAGLNEVKGDLEQIRSNLKSRRAAILERLKVNSA
jgi:hypothetical protein